MSCPRPNFPSCLLTTTRGIKTNPLTTFFKTVSLLKVEFQCILHQNGVKLLVLCSVQNNNLLIKLINCFHPENSFWHCYNNLVYWNNIQFTIFYCNLVAFINNFTAQQQHYLQNIICTTSWIFCKIVIKYIFLWPYAKAQ